MHGIDDEDFGLHLGGGCEDGIEIVFADKEEIFGGDAEPICTDFDLFLRFFARGVKYCALRGGGLAHLQEECGFADARIAADEHERACDDAAAEYSIEFGNAAGEAVVIDELDFG